MRFRLTGGGWSEPLECPAGHVWPPKGGRLVGWRACECAGTVQTGGHRTFWCLTVVDDGRECGEVMLMPPHEPGARRSGDPRLQLITWAAALPSGVSRIEIRYDHQVVGDLDFRVCDDCQVGVIENIRVDAQPTNYRRRGFGRQALRVALNCGVRYAWSTTVTAADATEFWAAVGQGIGLGRARHCPHMQEADERLP